MLIWNDSANIQSRYPFSIVYIRPKYQFLNAIVSKMSRQLPSLANISTSHTRNLSHHSITSPRTPASPFDPLSAALTTAQSSYTLANSKSLSVHNAACNDFPGGNTRTVLHASPFPITFNNGEGCELVSLDGEVYIDFLSEFTAGIYGHSNPTIQHAITSVLLNGWNFGGPNLHEKALAAKITARFAPSGIELVRFTNSGTEANTMALATAVASTQRRKILVFANGYHGGTLAFPATLGRMNTNLPHEFVIAPYNDIAGTEAIITALPRDSLAAVLVEPIQGNGGCIVGSRDFLQFLDKSARDRGALFIVDEVMTSRLAYHGLSAALGLSPDLVTLGKWVGGGMTFGAFGGRREGVMALFDPRTGVLGHSGTFNNNIVTMAAGCAGMDIYNKDEVVQLNALGESLKAGVEKVLERHGVRKIPTMRRCAEKYEDESPFTGLNSENPFDAVGIESLSLSDEAEEDKKAEMWITGQGSMLCIHFEGGSEKTLKPLFWHHMLDRGIFMAQRGFIALNIELTEAHVEKFVGAVESFIGKYRMALS